MRNWLSALNKGNIEGSVEISRNKGIVQKDNKDKYRKYNGLGIQFNDKQEAL